MKWRKEISLKTQTTGRESGELHRAARTWEHYDGFGRAEGRRCEDTLREGDGAVLDGLFCLVVGGSFRG